MARRQYPVEFRKQQIAMVRAGRTPELLAKEFEPSAQTIRNCAVQADRDGGVPTFVGIHFREAYACFSTGVTRSTIRRSLEKSGDLTVRFRERLGV